MDRIQIQDTSWWTGQRTEDRGQCIQTDKTAAVQNTRAGRCVAAACCVVVVAPKGVFSALRALSVVVCRLVWGFYLDSFAASNIGCTYSTVDREKRSAYN